MPVILATSEAGIRRSALAKSETLSQKYPTQKRAGGVAQVVEHLPSKCEALSSNPSTRVGGREVVPRYANGISTGH
jgi:hypothetical protein